MRKKQVNLEQEQLFTLFSKYSNYIDNSDDRGLLIGYSILNALLNYNTKTNSTEERMFEEVKTIHHTLKSDLELLTEHEPSNIILNIKFEVDKKISNHYKSKSQSEVANTFVHTLTKKKNEFEYIRNIGLRLYDIVREKGPFTGNRNILVNDYETIKEAYR